MTFPDGVGLAIPARPFSVWIELTSKCPLRCAFCSRENLRGEGVHMEPSLLQALMEGLPDASVIRLNYSGESGNYPWLLEAITLAKARTRARVEVVTSLVSMPMEAVRGLGDSGIDRISISLHTLEAGRFPVIYGGGTISSFSQRLDALIQSASRAIAPPSIDFAAVAMKSNVEELPAIASLAAKTGAQLLSIHPVIRRSGVPDGFSFEAGADGALTDTFRHVLESNVAAARELTPGLKVSVARPPLPYAGVRYTCEQNPFETTHVLAGGEVVVCEVLDRSPVGNIKNASLSEIWNGPEYNAFRFRYANGHAGECIGCIFRRPASAVGAVQTLWGWHEPDEGGALWSRAVASFQCDPAGHSTLVLKGLLPGGSNANAVRFFHDGQEMAKVRNAGEQPLEFEAHLRIDDPGKAARFEARVETVFSPWRRGLSGDTRELGFALFDAYLSDVAAVPPLDINRINPGRRAGIANTSAQLLPAALRLATNLARRQTLPEWSAPHNSFSIVIPERGASALLAGCLDSLGQALANLSAMPEVVISVNGSARADYADLMARWPMFRFVFADRSLGFTSAVRFGLKHVHSGWTYLLNSDMRVAPDSFSSILPWRDPGVFSLASRISMLREEAARETNRTRIELLDGLPNLIELDCDANGPVEHSYSGGGSSLFQTALLRYFTDRTTCYDPFYWEDAEWGIRAAALGLKNLFVPASRVEHFGRATVNRFYEADEASRIFERNRLQFHLRCMPDADTPSIRERLATAPAKTIRELLHPRRLGSMLCARASTVAATL